MANLRNLLMLSVAISGCQYLGDPDQFRIENSDQSQRAEVKSAMQEWNSAIDGAQLLELNEDGGSVIRVRADDVTIEGFEIDGRGGGDLGRDSSGIHITGHRVVVRDCAGRSFSFTTVEPSGSKYVTRACVGCAFGFASSR